MPKALVLLCAGIIGGNEVSAQIHILSVTSSAGFTQEIPSPGSLASIFCTGLTGFSGVQVSAGPPYPFELGGVQVTVNNKPAPVLAVATLGGYQQINIQLPWDTARSPIVVHQGSSQAVIECFASQGWGVFFAENGFAVPQHAGTYLPVTEVNPAKPGEWIIAYGTNLGPVQSPPNTGFAARPNPLSPVITSLTFPVLTLSASIHDGVNEFDVENNYIGLAPFLVGVYQLNLKVPTETRLGEAALFIVKYEFCAFPQIACNGQLYSRITSSVRVKLPVGSK